MNLTKLKKPLYVAVAIISFNFLSLGAWGVGADQGLRLSCEYLSFIENSYLKNHIIAYDYNRNLESRVVDQFIKKLDGSKMYLMKKDVDQIKTWMQGIGKKTKKRDCGPIMNAQNLYIQRVFERVEYVKKALADKKFKVDKNTEIIISPDDRDFAKSVSQLDRFYDKYLQFRVANYMATGESIDEAKGSVTRSYERSHKRIKEMDQEELLSIYVDAFAHAFDPHSSFLSRDQLEDFQIQMSLSLEGIGATLSSKDGFTTIEQLIAGGAAMGSGQLKPKDKIIAVAQTKTEKSAEFDKPENVIEMDLREVVRRIRGPKGTKVRLTILRKEGKENKKFEVVLTRAEIKLEDEAATIEYVQKDVKGMKKKIGLINLPSFYADSTRQDGRSAAKDMKILLREAKKNKVDAVVLDLSTNGGGVLDDAVKIAGLFFKTGNVVKQSQRMGENQLLADIDPAVDFAGPLVVLTSRVSASASEIVAGTLKDYKRAIIVGGDHTFGKGSVQSVARLHRSLGAAKTTVGMFFTAGGASTQHRGVEGDIVFPSVLATDEIGEKNLDYSLPPKKIKSFLSKEAYVKTGNDHWEVVDRALVKKLKTNSLERIAKSSKFKEIKEDISKNKKRGKIIKVAEILDEDSDAKKKEKEQEESVNLSKEEKRKKYLERADIEEALNIAADYVGLSSVSKMSYDKGKKDKVSKNEI